MALDERTVLAIHGIVVVAVEVVRDGPTPIQAGEAGRCLHGRVRVTTRGMWTGMGALLQDIHTVRGGGRGVGSLMQDIHVVRGV